MACNGRCGCGGCTTAQSCGTLSATRLRLDEEEKSSSGLADLSDCTVFQDAVSGLSRMEIEDDQFFEQEYTNGADRLEPIVDDGSGSGGGSTDPTYNDTNGTEEDGVDPVLDPGTPDGQLYDGRAAISGAAVGIIGLFGLGLIRKAIAS